MKQPEAGTRNDLIEHRFRIAKEDLETAYLLNILRQRFFLVIWAEKL